MILGFNIVVYLFCAGAGTGLYAMTVACDFQNQRWGAKAPLQKRLLRDRLPVGLAVSLCALGVLFLVLDLGKPDRMIELFLSPHPTAITAGSYALAAFLLTGTAQFFLRYLLAAEVSRWVDGLLTTAAMLSACFVMVYAGALLADMPGIDLWASPCVPLLFAGSALSSGCGLLMVIDTLAPSEEQVGKQSRHLFLSHVDRVLLVAEAALLAVLLVGVAASCADGSRAAHSLVAGTHALAFWLGLVALGLVAPLGIESVRSIHSSRSTLPQLLTGAFVLIGCFMMRYCIVAGGAYGSLVLPGLSL